MSADVTQDALFGGAVPIWQPAHGYRVNVDAVLLAHFARGRRAARLALDLGAGVGGITLTLHYFGAVERSVLLEREPELVKLAERNLGASGIHGSVRPVDLERDGLPLDLAGSADLVVCNPPFFEPAHARPRREPLERASRSGALAPFLAAAARATEGPRARVVFAYPAQSLASFLRSAESVALCAKRLRFVHARGDSPARLCLVELRRAKPGGLVVEPPLYEWIAPGTRSAELCSIIGSPVDDRK